MKFRSLFQLFYGLILVASAFAVFGVAQRSGGSVPRQEKLLNGLKLVMWNDPAAENVKISIRIHSGSAFDPQGKEGVMKLLAENIFPTPASREFFTEDLGGSVEVVSNYDYIQVNASAKSSEWLTLLDTVAQAISRPTIDKDTTASLKMTLAARLASLEKDPGYVADHATMKRLFGAFPYGRPQMGSTESLQRIDFADLQFAKDKFLLADNATLAISGNFNSDLGYRAVRRYFGAWSKSDRKVPSTFKQPDAPDTKPLEISLNGASAHSSFALRGLARNDPDYFASLILEGVLRVRASSSASISNEARVLPGVVMLRMAGSSGFPFAVLSDRISQAEFAQARDWAIGEFAKRPVADQWLDADTYRTDVGAEATALQKLTLVDVQRVADRLAKNPVVSVVVKPAASAQ
jgi:predicted Zn-dependent peptidase